MRYILGVSIHDKTKNTTKEGYAIVNSIGLFPSMESEAEIKKAIDEGKEVATIVYKDIETVQKVISEYSVKFRRDDVWRDHQIWKKSKYIIKFYPIKVDSSKFPFKIGNLIPSRKQPMGQEKQNVYELKGK